MIQDGKLRGFAMGHAIPVRTDYTAGEVRRFAQRAKDAAQARRLLAVKKISGNSCGRTGCRTEVSNPSTISSITAATLGTRSSISRGKSCPSPAAIGQPQITQSEDWYKSAKWAKVDIDPSRCHQSRFGYTP